MEVSINLSLSCIITLLSVLSDMIKAEQCIYKSSCSCQLENSNFILNLKPLSSASKPSLIAPDDKGVYRYVYNPCDALVNNCKGTTDVAVCQETMTGTDPKPSYCAGKETGATFSGDLQLNTLNIVYACNDGTTTRKTHINVVCDKDITGSLKYVTTTEDGYHLQLRTKYACIDLSSSSGLSPGSVLLLIFFILLIVYLIGGVLFMKFARGASGVEMVPNLEFWKGLPSLIKDGLVFVSKGCKADTTYSQI